MFDLDTADTIQSRSLIPARADRHGVTAIFRLAASTGILPAPHQPATTPGSTERDRTCGQATWMTRD